MSKQVAKKEEIEPVVNEGSAILSLIERAARDETVDIDKMERLLNMQERVIQRDAAKDFNDALRDAQHELPQVYRDASNSQTRSKYATLETIAKAVMPVITKHGFSMSFGTDASPLEGHYRITCELSHVGGCSKNYHADVPSDTVGMKGSANKTATHGFGSTMSYGRRYLTLLIFNITLTDEDNDGNSPQGFINEAQQKILTDLVTGLKGDEAPLFNYLKINSWAEVPANKFDWTVGLINKKYGAKS